MKTTTQKITWTARNNSSFLDGVMKAKTIPGAVRAARKYIREELYGEGIATIFLDGEPARTDERSIFTGMAWKVKQHGQ